MWIELLCLSDDRSALSQVKQQSRSDPEGQQRCGGNDAPRPCWMRSIMQADHRDDPNNASKQKLRHRVARPICEMVTNHVKEFSSYVPYTSRSAWQISPTVA